METTNTSSKVILFYYLEKMPQLNNYLLQQQTSEGTKQKYLLRIHGTITVEGRLRTYMKRIPIKLIWNKCTKNLLSRNNGAK